MKRRSSFRIAFFGIVALALNACGGGGGGTSFTPPPAATYDLQAAHTSLVNTGLTASVTLSGSVDVNGTAVPFTGTGTLTYAPGTAATFNNVAAMLQTQSISGTVTAQGQSGPYSTSVDDFFATSDGAFLGENSGNEYDVVQTPMASPNSVVGGSSGSIGTVSRYTDSSMGVSLGTTQVTYAVTAATQTNGPLTVKVTNKIYDTQNTLVETDVTTYSLSSSNALAFTSGDVQSSSGNLTVTAQ
jgi:hypothetical protein